ncbi:MAG TPA: EAL domain-containing protein [Mycobacterium sp.]
MGAHTSRLLKRRCLVPRCSTGTNPHRSPISPEEFIPVAEESGLIDRIDRWVLEEALREAQFWAELRPDSPPLRVAINISLPPAASEPALCRDGDRDPNGGQRAGPAHDRRRYRRSHRRRR